MPEPSTSGFPESLSDAKTKNNPLWSKLIYGPRSLQSSSVSVLFLVSVAARHQLICFCGPRLVGGSLCACSTAQL